MSKQAREFEVSYGFSSSTAGVVQPDWLIILSVEEQLSIVSVGIFLREREAPRKVSLVRIGRTILHDLQTIWIVMIRDLYRICTMAKSYIAKYDLGAHGQSVCVSHNSHYYQTSLNGKESSGYIHAPRLDFI